MRYQLKLGKIYEIFIRLITSYKKRDLHVNAGLTQLGRHPLPSCRTQNRDWREGLLGCQRLLSK